MANATISPALPALEASFAGEPGAAYLTRFLVSAPSLTVVLVAPFAGLAADRYGRGIMLIAGILLFVVAGSAGAYLPDLVSILVSRLVLGVAVAMTMTAQVALVGDLFSGSRRSAFMGWQTTAINFSGLLFIGLAGLLAGQSPRLPFLVYALPILFLPLLISIHRQEKQSEKPNGNQDGTDQSHGAKVHWFGAAISVAALTMFTVMLFFLMPSQLPFYLDANGFDSASATTVGLGTLMLTGGIVAMVFKRLSERLGLAATLAVGYALMAAGFCVLAVDASWLFVLPGAALIGAGYALVQPGFLFLALQVAPKERRGSVSGIVTTAMFLGQVISPLLLTPFIQRFGFSSVYFAATATFTAFSLGAFVPMFQRRRLNQKTV
ncbi:MAG: MFS transporter [Roseibium sp.]|nr:MFS transporter [Roseibium sp.]